LPPPLEKLAVECSKVGAVIVLTRTALLEVERHQTELMESEIRAVEKAYNKLRSLGIAFEEKDAASLFELPDVAKLFRDTGAKVEIEEPLLEDFHDAHRRACLHLSPHPPAGKSDEMRDLVIWAVALRLAKNGDVILLSRDEVHTHDRGDEEASSGGLLRAKDVDEALELLGIESPTGRLVRLLLAPVWIDLRAGGLPLLPEPNLRKIEDAAFTQGESGLDRATFKLQTGAENGGTLRAEFDIRRTEEVIRSVSLRAISIDNQVWEGGALDITPNKPVPLPPPDLDEPLG
jgi:hypothetical protein